MNRRETEQHRLFGPADARRALVLEVRRPAGWDALATVWQDVQDNWGWPAPAIAVNGRDGFQLWFGLAQAVSADEARACVQLLVTRHLTGLPGHCVGAWSACETGAVPALPPALIQADQWSAFLTPGLAAVFADSPWLDIAPSDDGQADLLAALRPITPAEWARARDAWQRNGPGNANTPPAAPTSAHADGAPANPSPRQFLLQVMHDDAAPLALRVEAAKALLLAPGGASEAGG